MCVEGREKERERQRQGERERERGGGLVTAPRSTKSRVLVANSLGIR